MTIVLLAPSDAKRVQLPFIWACCQNRRICELILDAPIITHTCGAHTDPIVIMRPVSDAERLRWEGVP